MIEEKMRGVYERVPGSGIWWICYKDTAGARHREKIGRRSVAVEAYINRKREIREGTFVAPTRKVKITFRALADLAMESKALRLSRRTCANDSVRAERLKKFGKIAAVEVTAEMIESTLRQLQLDGPGNRKEPEPDAKDAQPRPPLSGSTVNRYRSFISSVFRYGVRHGHVKVNPVAAVERYRETDHRIRFLDKAEELALRRAILASEFPEREASMDLALNTGMRLGEQLTLTWENVSLELGLLTVHGKTGRRHISINNSTRTLLEKLYKISNGATLVNPGWSHKWWTGIVRAAGVENFRWHDLRHTFASRLAMAGVDMRTVQDLMGHKSIEMTMKYAHLSPDHKMRAVLLLDPKMVPSEVPPTLVPAERIGGLRSATTSATRVKRARVRSPKAS